MNDYVLAWSDAVLDLQDLLIDYPEPIYIVGGAVRDALLRRPIKDVDIAVAFGSGIKLARRIANQFSEAGNSAGFFALDPDRDVGRALLDTPDGRLSIDVAGFRGDSLDDDLRDRDFTLNAMAVDLRGDLNRVIDPTGGAGDAIAKLIRRCNPDSLSHDPIRALRAIRQSVQFGFRIEPETLADVRAQVPHLLDTSIERVRDELFKLLALQKPGTALRVADHLGALTLVFPELIALHGLKQHPAHAYDGWNHTLAVVDSLNDILTTISYKRTDETTAQFNLGMIAVALDRFRSKLDVHFAHIWADERSHRALVMLAALLHDVGKPMVTPVIDENGYPRFRDHERVGADAVVEIVERLHLSRGEQDRVFLLVRYHMGSALWLDELTPVAIHRYWRLLGEGGIDLIFLTLADYLGAKGSAYEQERWLWLVERAQTLLEAYYEKYDQLVEPPTLINGTALMRALNLAPGPLVGELLERIREAQVSGEVTNADEAVQLARSVAGNSNGKVNS